MFRVLTFAFICCLILLQAANAQTFTVLHNFTGGPDGKLPETGIIDAAGNFYGTTQAGGDSRSCSGSGCGVVFKLSQKNSAWVLSTLYAFTGGNDGSAPRAGLTFGPDGSIYGATVNGGSSNCGGGCGTVYRLRPPATFCHSVSCSWTENILHRFTAGTDGALPSSNVSFDAAGNMYGTTRGGGGSQYCTDTYGCGVVYELSPSQGGWTENLLHTFTGGSDGENPAAGVVMNSAGDFFGTCDGPVNDGSVYQLSPSGSGFAKTYIYQFQGGPDGYDPIGLIIDSAGNLYGATTYGGAAGGGTVYELSPAGGGWNYSLLYGLSSGNPHLYGPVARLTMDAAGNLYGTTLQGGQYQGGSVFKLTLAGGSWTYTSLHDFTGGSDGGDPGSRVVLDSQGNVYGTTEFGGFYGDGIAFKISQ